MEINVSDLTGMALDWAVMVANRGKDRIPSPSQFKVWGGYHPSTNWMHGGPLIDLYGLGVVKFYPPVDGPVVPGCEWAALWIDDSDRRDGPTALIAACRCIVANKLGPVINVPDELL